MGAKKRTIAGGVTPFVNEENKMLITSEGTKRWISVGEIRYLHKTKRLVHIHLDPEKEITFYGSLGQLQEILKNHGFIRVQRGFIIQKQQVESYKNMTFVLTGGVQVPCGRKYRDEALKSLGFH